MRKEKILKKMILAVQILSVIMLIYIGLIIFNHNDAGENNNGYYEEEIGDLYEWKKQLRLLLAYK